MKTHRRIIAAFVFFVLVLAVTAWSYSYGVEVGARHPKEVLVKHVANAEREGGNAIEFKTFWEAWQRIDDEYLKSSEIDGETRVYGAIRGLVQSLNDPYSDFFNPEDSKKFQEDIRGNFSGIGAEIGFREGILVIVAPLKDMPASKAGLKPGDKILKIDDTATEGLSIDRAVRLIRGPKDSSVNLLIQRTQWDEPKEFKIVRDNIVAPTLDLEMKDGSIAYIKLYAFNANTSYLLSQAAVRALGNGAKGIILDLRGNPGGYLDTAVDVAGWFLPRNTLVVREVGRSEEDATEFRSRGSGLLKDIPVVILINEASASASEIVSGALRDQRGAQIVGEKSFGKGTVQELTNFSDNSSIKLTVAHWVLPSGKILEGEGLVPDHVVEISEDDLTQGKDPQLEKAMEVLVQSIVR